MPKMLWGIGEEEPDDLAGFYEGDLPPAGVYDVALKRMSVKLNSNNDRMLSILVEIRSEDPAKKEFNGAGVWTNQNITDVGAKFLKAFLKAFGWTWQDFMTKTITESKDLPTAVVGIGRVKIDSEPMGRVQFKRGSYQGNPKLEVAQWLAPKEDDEPYGEDAPEDDPDNPFA